MPITYSYDSFYGPMVDVMNFFSCGLPGGLDYAMLFAVKHGWMASITEKKYNSTINNWLRAPGIIFTCGIVYVQGKGTVPCSLSPANIVMYRSNRITSIAHCSGYVNST